MNGADAIIAKLDALEVTVTKETGRLDRSINRVFERLDKQAELGHEPRLAALEKRLDGMWGKVTGLVTLVTGGVAAVYHAIKE